MMKFIQLGRARAVGGASTPSQTYTEKLLGSYSTGLLAYWPLNESSGTSLDDASSNNYVATVAAGTLGVTGIGDGQTALRFNGSTSTMNGVGSANGLNTAWGTTIGTAGTVQSWWRVASGNVWTDTAVRYAWEITSTAQNRISFLKTNVDNTLTLAHRGGNVPKSVSVTSITDTLWHHAAITWDTAADQVKFYLDGAQVGATQTTIGAFSGNPGTIRFGSQSASPAGPWFGDLAHPAIWTRALTSSEIAALATAT